MFPRGFKHNIMWQKLQDIVSPVEIYLCLCLCVREGGGPILSIALILSSIPLICSSWSVFWSVFFHGVTWRASFRLLLTGNTRKWREQFPLAATIIVAPHSVESARLLSPCLVHTASHTRNISEHRSQSGHLHFDQSLSYLCSWMWSGWLCST